MSIINEITDVKVTAFLSLPPQYIFKVTGNVAMNHWKEVKFEEVINIVPPKDRIQESNVEIELASDSAPTQEMQPVVASTHIMFLADWAVGVRFKAQNNSVEKHLGGPHKKFEINSLHLAEMVSDNSPIPFPFLDRPVPWPWKKIIRKENNPTPFPLAFSADDLSQSVSQFLTGRKLRVLKPGDVGTADIDPGRVTIHLADSGRIESVQIDPDLPGS